ncbi:MAG TPA: cytochrome c [Steroidobacter sp.]
MIRAIAAISFVCTAVWSSGLARADEMDPQVVIEGRQANLRDLGAAFKAITDELKKSAPSLAVIRQYAGQVDALAQQQRFWFPRGSGPESEIETAAKPEIWSRTKEFVDAQLALVTEAARLREVAGGSDLEAIKSQHRAVGKTCKGCHDAFREEE